MPLVSAVGECRSLTCEMHLIHGFKGVESSFKVRIVPYSGLCKQKTSLKGCLREIKPIFVAYTVPESVDFEE